MELKELSSKDRALLALKALVGNGDGKLPMVARTYVVEKIERCIGNPFPEQMLDKNNRETFNRLVREVN